MGKRGRNQKTSKSSVRSYDIDMEDMDDEIDAFHKQRDFVPLDVNHDSEESNEDEMPVFDVEDDKSNTDEDEEDGADDDVEDDGLAAKIVRQKRYLQAKYGGVDDEMDDNDSGKDEKDRRVTWGGRKGRYFGGDNADFELQSSDDESLAEEEEEVLRLQRKAAESLTAEDLGLEDDDSKGESEENLTLEEMSAKGKPIRRSFDLTKPKKDMDTTVVEEVKKDLNSLSREEQMDVVYSSAPELVGLLSELNDGYEELENKLNPLLSELKGGGVKLKGGMRYLEVKQVLLLAYCQAITFYLLLRSEGHPVGDHPVIARLVEIKALLDKIKALDGNLPPDFEEIVKKKLVAETVAVDKNGPLASNAHMEGHRSSCTPLDEVKDIQEALKLDGNQPVDANSLEKNQNKKGKRKHKDVDQEHFKSSEMLKVRAALEEKLKQKGSLDFIKKNPEKPGKRLKFLNGKLEGPDDYGDDVIDPDSSAQGAANKSSSMSISQKVSQLVAAASNKPKIASGDYDVPKRDDIGERRRKHELRVLARAGVKSEDDSDDKPGDSEPESVEGEAEGFEDEFYTRVKRQREAKLAAKVQKYARKPLIPSLPQTVEGKRPITYQMEKNKGLTRRRKKDLKNPRKKYRTKHQEKVKRRKGQVREIRRPMGPYGGEPTGINANISRSTRFK